MAEQTKICEYHDCKRIAIRYFKTTNRWCCENNAKRCPAVKKQQKITCLKKYGTENASSSLIVQGRKKQGFAKVDWKKVAEKRKITCQEKYGVDNPSQSQHIQAKRQKTFIEKYGCHPLKTQEVISKRIKTSLKKYGVTNPGISLGAVQKRKIWQDNVSDKYRKEMIDKALSTKVKRGQIIDRSLKDPYKLYKNDVYNYSQRQYKKYKNKINPHNLPIGRTKYHLDHKFSICEAFKHNISIEIIGHWTNLEMLSYVDNIIKGASCSITYNELYKNYRNTK